jgi:hypothetical protein
MAEQVVATDAALAAPESALAERQLPRPELAPGQLRLHVHGRTRRLPDRPARARRRAP